MYIYIYIIIYILIKEAIAFFAFFAFFAFLSFAKIWFTMIYIVWSHTGNFFLFKVKKLSEGASRTDVFFLFGVIRIITCAGASRTDVFFLGLKNNCLRRPASPRLLNSR